MAPSVLDQEPEAVIWTMWELLNEADADVAVDADPMSDPSVWGV